MLIKKTTAVNDGGSSSVKKTTTNTSAAQQYMDSINSYAKGGSSAVSSSSSPVKTTDVTQQQAVARSLAAGVGNTLNGTTSYSKTGKGTTSASSSTPVVQVAATTAKKNPYENPSEVLNDPYYGVTDATRAALNGSYAPSQAVIDAQNYLASLRQNAPGEYNDPYADQLYNLYQQITNRPKFSYDLNGDMLYKQLAQQYQIQGRQAMQDTMGQAAALTGGYGSSYASTAGNQAYQAYLQQLNDRAPELYNLALNTYNAEGDRLSQNYSMLRGMSDTDYGRYQDKVNRYYTDLGLATDAYNNERNFDYGQFSDNRNYNMQMAQMEAENARANQSYYRNIALTMLKAGQRPSNAVLNAAGLYNYDAWQLYQWAKNGGKL